MWYGTKQKTKQTKRWKEMREKKERKHLFIRSECFPSFFYVSFHSIWLKYEIKFARQSPPFLTVSICVYIFVYIIHFIFRLYSLHVSLLIYIWIPKVKQAKVLRYADAEQCRNWAFIWFQSFLFIFFFSLYSSVSRMFVEKKYFFSFYSKSYPSTIWKWRATYSHALRTKRYGHNG